MDNFRGDGWDSDKEIYSPSQVEAVLRQCGIEIASENDGGFLSFCPYHGNRDTPAFGTNSLTGASECFNPACGEYVSLEKLVRDQCKTNHFGAKRIIMSKVSGEESLEDKVLAIQSANVEFPEFSPEIIAKCKKDFWEDEDQLAHEYMSKRSFSDQTLDFFNVGYSFKNNMVTVPMYTAKNHPVGFVGRAPSFEDKTFKNSKGLPKRRLPWNINNARKYETCIITESSFDAMRVHQAGYPNVVALLGGGSFSQEHQDIMKRHFSRLVIMTDNDQPIRYRTCRKCLRAGYEYCAGHRPGRDLGMDIASKMPMTKVLWAAYDDKEIYARGVKDATDMTDDEIRQSLKNAISHAEYLDWQVN